MEYNFEYDIQISTDDSGSENAWRIVEKDKETGEQIGVGWIPMEGATYLRVTQLKLRRELSVIQFTKEQRSDLNLRTLNEDSEQIACYEQIITGAFALGVGNSEDTYSIFGSNDTVSRIDLRVVLGAHYSCRLSGSPGLRSSIHHFSTNGSLTVHLELEHEEFSKLSELIDTSRLEQLDIRIDDADGLYIAENSGSVGKGIKLLCEEEPTSSRRSILVPEKNKCIPPPLGWVREFEVSFDTTHDLARDNDSKKASSDLLALAKEQIGALRSLMIIGWAIVALLAAGLWVNGQS